ncbi:MAG: translocation/assembly module TamB domain-containing protein [Deltaproteobacteria bacterium]|nr:translocation/assembly module TamB domain-containing protein [Deltaproteobacteria bacterium]
MADRAPETPPEEGTTERKPKRPLWWRWVRGVLFSLLGLVLFVLLTVAIALFLLQTDWGKAKVLDIALDAVNQGIRGTVRIDHIDGPVIRRIALVGVEIEDPDGQTALTLDRLELEYRLLPLIGKRVEIHHLGLIQPKAEILDEQGRVRLARAFAPKNPSPTPSSSEGLDWTIVLDRIAVADARIAQSSAEDAIALTDLTLEASIAVDEQGLRWDELRITGAAQGLPVDRIELSAAGALRGDSLVLSRLSVVAGPHALNLHGRIDRLDAPVIDLDIERAHVELEPLGGLLGRDDLRGTIEGSGHVAGPLDHLTAGLDFVSPGGAISLRATGDVLATDPEWVLALAARELRPRSIAPDFEWPLVVSFDLSGRGQGDPLSTGEAHVSFQLRELSGVDFVPTPLRLQASAVRGALSVEVSTEDALGGQLSLEAHGRLPPGPVSATVEMSGIDIGAWTRLAGLSEVEGHVDSMRLQLDAVIGAELGAGFDLSAVDEATLGLDLEANDIAVPESLGMAASLGHVSLSTDLEWAGEGLPVGRATVRLRDVAAAGVAVAGAEVTARLEEEADGLRVRGELSASGASQGSQISVRRASAPFDLFLDPEGSGRGDLDLDVSGVRAPGVRLDAATADVSGSLADEILTVRGPVSVTGVALDAGQKLEHAEGTIDATVPLARPDRLEAATDLRLEGLRIDAETRVASATVKADVALAGSLPSGHATIHAKGIHTSAVSLDEADLRARFAPKDGGVVELKASGDEASLALGVSVEPVRGNDPIRATIGELELRTGEHGFAASPGATLLYNRRTGGGAVTRLEIHDLAEPRASLSLGMLVEPTSGSVAGTVSARKAPLEAWLASLRGFGIDPLPDVEVGGVLDLTARVEGTLRHPTVDLDLLLADGHIGPLEDLRLAVEATIGDEGTRGHVEARWNEDRAIVASVQSAARVTFEGPPAITPETPFATDIQLTHVVLEDFAPWLRGGGERPPKGVLSGSVVIGGTLGLPVAAVDIDLDALDYGPIADGKVHLGVLLGDSGSKVDVRLVDDEVERIVLTAEVPSNIAALVVQPGAAESLFDRLRREPVLLRLRIAPTRLTELPFTGGLGDLQLARFVAAFDVSGTIGEPSIAGQLRVDDIHVVGGTAGLGLDLNTTEGDLAFTAALSGLSGEALRFEGLLPRFGPRLVGTEPALAFLDDPRTRFTLSSSTDVGTITDVSPELGRFLDGAIPGAEIELSLDATGGTDAEARLMLGVLAAPDGPSESEPSSDPKDHSLASALHVDVRLRRQSLLGTITVEQRGGDGRLFIEASAPVGLVDLVQGRDIAAADLTGSIGTENFALGGLGAALPGVFGATIGKLDADVIVAGTIESPKIDGNIVAHFQRVVIAPAGFEAEDLDVALRLTPEQLRLEPIHIERDKGTLDLRLSIDTPGLDTDEWALDGALSLRKFQIVARRDVRVKASGDIVVDGTLAAPAITGELTVDDGKIDPDIGGRTVHSTDMPEDVVFVSAGDIGAPKDELLAEEGETEVATGGLSVDATVIIPKRTLFVKNDMFDIELSGHIRARIRGEQISLEGMINVERGKVKVLGREFKLSSESRVIFDGSPEVDPILDVTATYDISDVDLSAIGQTATDDSRIIVHVSGHATDPKLDLTSDPPMDETNIVSIITVGHPVGGGGDSPAVRSQLLTAMVGLALGPATKFITDKLHLDVLQVEVGEDAALSDARITAGTRIRRDLYILYDADLGADENENVHELRIIYSMKRGLKIETYYGDAGKGGIELLLRRTF